jgi:hypothetical protein
MTGGANESISIDSNGNFSQSWTWSACCNDGAVIGPLALDFDVSLTITAHNATAITGISTYDASTLVPLAGATTDTVRFREDY